jgi:hypothetical protein
VVVVVLEDSVLEDVDVLVSSVVDNVVVLVDSVLVDSMVEDVDVLVNCVVEGVELEVTVVVTVVDPTVNASSFWLFVSSSSVIWLSGSTIQLVVWVPS